MPLIEAGFCDSEGKADWNKLLAYGPTIQVSISPLDNSESPDETKIKNVVALVDTGASNCMVDIQLAEELGLIAIDKADVSGIGGAIEYPVYMANLIIPHLDIYTFGRFIGCKLKEGGQQHEMLLGRDFLANTIMIYDGFRAQISIATLKK